MSRYDRDEEAPELTAPDVAPVVEPLPVVGRVYVTSGPEVGPGDEAAVFAALDARRQRGPIVLLHAGEAGAQQFARRWATAHEIEEIAYATPAAAQLDATERIVFVTTPTESPYADTTVVNVR